MLAAASGIRELLDWCSTEAVLVPAMVFLTAAWFATLGACLGSFLNVVVYRMPREISLIRDGSRCPSCGTPIQTRDNLPVLGWLLLRGRCRACRWSIPVRYPLVEALVAAQFVTLLFVEVVSGGRNLPVRPPELWTGVANLVWAAKAPELLVIYGHHLTLWFVATGIWLMAIDGSRVPAKWLSVGLTVGLVLPLLEPQVLPFLWADGVTSGINMSMRGMALVAAITGLLVGTVVGALLSLAIRQDPCSTDRLAVTCMLGLGGLTLGWHAAISIGLWTVILRIALGSVGSAVPNNGFARLPAPLPFATWLALHVQVLGWRLWSSGPYWPGQVAHPVVFLLALIVMAITAWVLGRGHHRDKDTERDVERRG